MKFHPINPSKQNKEGIVQVCQPNELNSKNEWIMVCRDSVVQMMECPILLVDSLVLSVQLLKSVR